MKAAIYNPYWDTLGGGERYTISFAKVLADVGYRVDVEWKDANLLLKLEERFGLTLGDIKIVKDVARGDGYDVCFWVSDGSIPTLKARKNFLHFQVPFHGVKGKTLLNKMKLFRINKIICNSYFTKNIIDKEFGVSSMVIYPPVSVDQFKPKRKKDVILSVARFSQLKQAKGQDVLIDVFKKLFDKGLKEYELILAGGAEVGADKFLAKLKKAAKDYPVSIKASVDYKELKVLFGEAKLFWSAAGYGIDETKEPEKVEHFGISVVEAMAAGAVPLIYGAGGHKETVESEYNGYLWNKKSQLAKHTLKLIKDPKTLRKLAKISVTSSKVYEYERFEAQVHEVLD